MKYLACILTATCLLNFSSCQKHYGEFYRDNHPDIPVTYEGAVSHGFNPYITVPLADGTIRLTLTIPVSSGRTIREISRVHAGSTAITPGSVRTGSYLTEPISGSGTRVGFETNVHEFEAYNVQNRQLIQNFIRSTTATELRIAFVFLLQLDNGLEVIPVQAQVRLLK